MTRSPELLPVDANRIASTSLLPSRLNWESLGTRCVIPPGREIADADLSGRFCYLLERGLAATYVRADQDRATCVGLIAPGEIIGLQQLFGHAEETCWQARAVVATQVLRLPATQLAQALRVSPAIRDACVSQLQARLADVQVVAACNARHLLPARCANWLLKLQVRLGNTLPVTHEFLATVLGVRRAGVTVTLQALQRSGAIRQQRGSIVIADAARLKQSACSCPVMTTSGRLAVGSLPASFELQPPLRAISLGPRELVTVAVHERLARSHAGSQNVMRINTVLEICQRIISQTQSTLLA